MEAERWVGQDPANNLRWHYCWDLLVIKTLNCIVLVNIFALCRKYPYLSHGTFFGLHPKPLMENRFTLLGQQSINC